jgi:hypothetical protein
MLDYIQLNIIYTRTPCSIAIPYFLLDISSILLNILLRGFSVLILSICSNCEYFVSRVGCTVSKLIRRQPKLASFRLVSESVASQQLQTLKKSFSLAQFENLATNLVLIVAQFDVARDISDMFLPNDAFRFSFFEN